MVEISRQGKYINIDVLGLHKLFTFKNNIVIPREHIVNVYQDEMEVSSIYGFRAFGTSVPGLISAGTFMQEEGPVFLDVVNKKNAIIISLRDEYYKKLIVEVEDPSETIYFLAKN